MFPGAESIPAPGENTWQCPGPLLLPWCSGDVLPRWEEELLLKLCVYMKKINMSTILAHGVVSGLWSEQAGTGTRFSCGILEGVCSGLGHSTEGAGLVPLSLWMNPCSAEPSSASLQSSKPHKEIWVQSWRFQWLCARHCSRSHCYLAAWWMCSASSNIRLCLFYEGKL